jgi:hypothetical protein
MRAKKLTPIDRFRRDESNREYLDNIKRYFKFKYRGVYYMQMKYEVIKYLVSENYTHQEIAVILYGNISRHDTISILLRKSTDIEEADFVRENMDEWIKSMKYPISVQIDFKRKAYPNEYSDENGFTRINKTSFELVTLENLIQERL